MVELDKIDQDTIGRTLKIQFNLSSIIVNTHYMLGKCYTKIKQFPLATIHFDKCKKLDPLYRKFDIAFYRGSIFYQLGAFKEAEQLYRLAITNPAPNLQEESYKDIYYNLAAGLVEGTFTKTSEEQDPEVILSYFDNAMDCCPKESNLSKGLFLKELGRTAEAINYLLEAATLNSPQAHTELAEIYRNLGNYDLFTQHLQTELTQLHMALNIIVNNERINLEKLSLNSELKSRIDKYCGIETINCIFLICRSVIINRRSPLILLLTKKHRFSK